MRLRVDEFTITQILQTKDKRLTTEVIKPDVKRHKGVIVLELKLALKEFVLTYQHRTILSDALLIEKAKLLADEYTIAEALPLLRHKCAEYPLDQIYNIDETGLFYQYFLILYYFCININNCIVFSH